MLTSPEDELTYYSEFGSITDPSEFEGLFEHLPNDISQLCEVIHGLLIHVFWADRYGENLSDSRKTEPSIRHVRHILTRIQDIQEEPIDRSRPLKDRFVGNCRTYSVLMASMLQYQGIPARARCGFGRYFRPHWHEDHWICEYWCADQNRWIMVDAQLDSFQRRALKIEFDPLDVPRDQFIVGGKAWHSCRIGETDPNNFGIFDMRGWWFIRGNLVRDVAALNKVELLPWDGWGLIDRENGSLSQEDLSLLDEIASMTSDEVDFTSVRKAYETNDGLTVPPIIRSYTSTRTLEIELTTEKVV